VVVVVVVVVVMVSLPDYQTTWQFFMHTTRGARVVCV